MTRLFVAWILMLLPAFGLAQDLGVPLSWRKFSNSRPLNERISIAQNGINTILPQLDGGIGEFNGIGYWQSGNVWTVMANQDRYAGTTVNRARVVNNLNLVFNLRQNYDRFEVSSFNDDALWWAQAAIAGFRAYRDNNLLSHAVATWNHVTNYVITADQASSGRVPLKNFQISGRCEGTTMAGGVFWRPTADTTPINSITTGLYITTSALLAEITGDRKYTDAAILSAQWIRNHNINSNRIVLDTVDARDCSRSPASWLFTYNSGKYIEGLSVLADVTGDSQWRSLMITTVAAAVKNAPWQGSDGIITEGVSTSSNNDGVGFKAIFIRGLAEAFARNPSNNDLRILLHSYIDVQYNALLDLAANGNSYSSNWRGPPQGFTTWGQLAALDVLTSAIIAN
ncbi:CAZyme family GH76 [Agaricus bisporus var. burnettii]|uniref:CAZyme family GH76 n=1 Tax=Agaricus bisporus var. burnettii TaxID=192524 RepID=A0A8H7F0P9_AGABI|nr:CAZyme family GH76 [Agaricus bisporus var. burnettii]